MAINGADDGFADGVVELTPALYKVVAVSIGESLVAHFEDVGTGGESFLGAREDCGTDGGVGIEGVEGGVEVADEGGEEGVEGFGAVELDCSTTSELIDLL